MNFSDDELPQQQVSPLLITEADLRNVPTQELPIDSDGEDEANIVFNPFIPRYANDDLYCRVPIPIQEHVLMKVVRGREVNQPIYDLFLERTEELYLLHSKKQFGTQTYLIYTDAKADKYLGKVSSNFLGTMFTITDHNGVELAVVLYKPNILGFKGPRCMTILLPAISKQGKMNILRSSLYDMYKSNSKEIIVLQNKTPLWNEETNSYVLNFNGRVTVASVKNFQVTPNQDLDYILLQFGRVAANRFTLDCRYPISVLQAFGISLTSFESKIACE
eukprot:NODE_160_length_16633_cov_0.230132.p7 type:complete len:276 gc:universal NODE_160_length_16633_cov_0.230132:11418-12245(+)